MLSDYTHIALHCPLQDPTGQTQTTMMTAHSDPSRAEPRPAQSAPPPPQPQQQQWQQQEQQPPPQPSASKPEAAPAPKDPPPAEASASGAPPTRSRRLAQQAEEHAAELQRKEAERNLKQQRTILQHARIVRRCLKYATKILDRYDVSGCGQ